MGELVDVRVTARIIEIYQGGNRLASHVLAPTGVTGEYCTRDGDLPDGPKYQEWDGPRVREWAARIGEHTTTVVARIFASVPVEEQGLNAALAVLRLTRRYSSSRVERACQIALASNVQSPRYAHLHPILETRQDETGKRHPRFSEAGAASDTATTTGYVRGAAYYGGNA